MTTNFTNKAIDIVKEAVQKDNAEEYDAALSLYTQAVEYFMTGLKYEKNPSSIKLIKAKINEYLKRAEELKQFVEKGKNKKQVVKSGADSKSGGGDEKIDSETKKLQDSLSGAIVREKPNVRWDDVAGLKVAKELLKEAVILPIKFPQLFTGSRKPWQGILLYGPPGTGKSFLAKAVATEADSTFFSVSSSDLVSKFQGESERLVRNLFEMARKETPAIIFIDEVDSLCSNRSDGENDSARRIKTEFLVQMQGVGKGNKGLLVLGATNTPWNLDPAIRRRFEKRIYIPLPETEALKVMFKIHVGKDTPNTLTDDDFLTLANNSQGFSGSDISVLVRDALMEPVRRIQKSTRFKKVVDPKHPLKTMWEPCSHTDSDGVEKSLMDIEPSQLSTPKVTIDDFYKVLTSAKPSVGEEDIKQQEEWTAQFGQEG